MVTPKGSEAEARLAGNDPEIKGKMMLRALGDTVRVTEYDPTSYRGRCPFCGNPDLFVLHVDLARFICWACERRGGFDDFMVRGSHGKAQGKR